MIRTGIRALLDAEDDIVVVAEGGANGCEGVAVAIEHLPAIVLMDVQMPEMDGIEATRRIAHDGLQVDPAGRLHCGLPKAVGDGIVDRPRSGSIDDAAFPGGLPGQVTCRRAVLTGRCRHRPCRAA